VLVDSVIREPPVDLLREAEDLTSIKMKFNQRGVPVPGGGR
jgi:hypothetical protein